MKLPGFATVSRWLCNEFVYGGHLLSIGAVSIVYAAAVALKIDITWDCLLLMYLAPQSVYMYDRYKDLGQDARTNQDRSQHIGMYGRAMPLIIAVFAGVFAVVLLMFGTLSVAYLGLLLIAVGFSYALIFKRLTKKVIGFKSLFVSGCWATLIVFMVVYYSHPFDLSVVLLLLFVWWILFINISFCDIKDIDGDRVEGLLTFAVVLGSGKLVKLLRVLVLLAFVPILLGFYLGALPRSSLMLLLIIPYIILYLSWSQRAGVSLSYLTSTVVYGNYALWSILMLLGEKFL